MRQALPGAFTFILEASGNVPKLFRSKKKTIGIRIPANAIALQLVKQLGNPIVSTSIHDTNDIIEYTTDPALIHERYKKLVDIVIDGGMGKTSPSTVIDFSDGELTILREGLGDIHPFIS